MSQVAVNKEKLFNLRLLLNKFLGPEPKEMEQQDEILLSQDLTDEQKALLNKSLSNNDKLGKSLFEVTSTKQRKTRKKKMEIQVSELEEVSMDKKVKPSEEIEHEREN